MDDKRLIRKLNRGSREALRRIHDKYRDDLVRIAAGLLRDLHTAEDVVQEVFLKLIHNCGRYEVKKNLRGYLTTCVVNRVRSLHQSGRLRKAACLDEVTEPVSGCGGPEAELLCDEVYRRLYEAIATLPYEQKEALILHCQGRMKFKEIARLQETTTQTAISRYHYGLKKLRSLLNGEADT